jgi:hypothetical protein
MQALFDSVKSLKRCGVEAASGRVNVPLQRFNLLRSSGAPHAGKFAKIF